MATGDGLCLVSATGEERSIAVDGIERFRKILETASAGQHVGLLVSGVEKDDIARGDEVRGDARRPAMRVRKNRSQSRTADASPGANP